MVICASVLECLQRSSELQGKPVPEPAPAPKGRKSQVRISPPTIIEENKRPDLAFIRGLLAGHTCTFEA
jgi:hypothetical protein